MVSTSETQLTLPAPELIVEAAPLAVQEAPPNVLEAQSPTLMIQGILGELNLMGEITNAPGAPEGEEVGSSSTPEKEDVEDGKVVSIVQVFDSSAKRPEIPIVADAPLELAETLPRDESLVVIEASAPEGDARDLEAFRPEEEV